MWFDTEMMRCSCRKGPVHLHYQCTLLAPLSATGVCSLTGLHTLGPEAGFYQTSMDSSISCDSSSDTGITSFLQLPRAVQQHISSLLPPSERALTWRLVCRDFCDALSENLLPIASLSQPLPPHSVPWAAEAAQLHVRQLPFRHKLQLLCMAAASGSEVNLEVALTLLQPSIFPEMLQARSSVWAKGHYVHPDADVSAAAAGHPHLLRWLVRRCPGLVRPDRVIRAAAMACDLAGLQEAWDALQGHPCSCGSSAGGRGAGAVLDQTVLSAAAASSTADAVAKMEWVLAAAGGEDCPLRSSTAEAAARSGDVVRLRWLRGRGCSVKDLLVLLAALGHADLAVAQWLVDKAGCALPASNTGDLDRDHFMWSPLLHYSVQSADGVAKFHWLRERGCPPLLHSDDDSALLRLALVAAEAGMVEVVRYLHGEVGQGTLVHRHAERFGEAAAASDSIPMAQFLHQEGAVFSSRVFRMGRSRYGTVAMIRWLTGEAGVSVATNLRTLIRDWPNGKAAHRRDLLEAVQLLVGAGSSMWVADAHEGAQAVHAAAKRGDLHLVRYLLHELPHLGCRLDDKVLESAAEGGCEALLEWLVEQHSGCCLAGACSPYMPAAVAGDRGTLTALRRLGVPWGEGFGVELAVRKGCPVPVLRWLEAQRAPVSG